MSFLSTLQVDYGRDFLVALGIAYFGVKGFLATGTYSLALPYYQELLGAEANTYHRTLLYVSIPWAAKPFFGMLSDHFPIWGYRKRWYVIFASLLAFLGSLSLSLATPSIHNVWLFFMVVNGIVVIDLLFEAKYSELMSASRTNVSGANIISYAWGLGSLGAATGALWGAQMAHQNIIRPAFLLTAAPSLILMLTVYNKGMQESRNAPKTPIHFPLFIVACWITGSTLISAITVSSLSSINAAIIQLVLGVGLIYASLRWIPKFNGTEQTMAQCNVFLFLAEITAIRLTGATDYFFTADCPTGSGLGGNYPTPNFTYDFYLGWTPIVASVAGLGGVFVFTKWLQHWPLRYVFQGVAVVRILLVGVEVWQAGRHNLGRIDDGLLFLLSEGIIGPVISMMYLLPLVAVTSRMMPKGSEALTYGILAGYQNFGQVIANSLGLMLIEQSGVGQDCSFVDYPFLVFCGHIIAPLATIPLASLLVPAVPISVRPEEPPKKSPRTMIEAPLAAYGDGEEYPLPPLDQSPREE